ncbi:MAG: hypothetical protein HY209_01715 [Candidatus Omnitrophica bacterium]|nr:hypothetical protein [Candidatus Omnitrophota bacterium]
MLSKTNLNITLDKDLIRIIDTDRGQTPRSSFINSILSRFFKKSHEIFDWGEENRLAEQDIKAGRVKKFSNKNEAMKWLKN